MLKEIGVNMKLNIIQFAQHLDNIDAGRADFYRLGWIGDYPEPENFLNLFYGKNVPKDPTAISPINSTRYQNPEYDAFCLKKQLLQQIRLQDTSFTDRLSRLLFHKHR
jgi:oligopeptide transport system substrate-binding protein